MLDIYNAGYLHGAGTQLLSIIWLCPPPRPATTRDTSSPHRYHARAGLAGMGGSRAEEMQNNLYSPPYHHYYHHYHYSLFQLNLTRSRPFSEQLQCQLELETNKN